MLWIKEKMTFDLDRKPVLLGQLSSTDRIILNSARALPTLEESCEGEKMGHHIPLVISTMTEYGDFENSKVRRMSVSVVSLARECEARIVRRKGLMEANKFSNSIETITRSNQIGCGKKVNGQVYKFD